VGDGGVLAPVTHDSVGRAVLMQALDQPLSAYRRLLISPRGVTEIDAAGAHTQVLGVNATERLARCRAASRFTAEPYVPREGAGGGRSPSAAKSGWWRGQASSADRCRMSQV
jgi:hypothetical protein